MGHPNYSSEEIARRGRELYAERIRRQVEPEQTGKYLVLDIETGAFEIDAHDIEAIKRAKARRPEAQLYIVRVGYPAAYNLGGAAQGRHP